MKNYKYYFLDYYNPTVLGSEITESLDNRIESISNSTRISTIYLYTTIESIKNRFKKQKTMEKQREFKVGDKCVVEYTVTEIVEKHEYPINCRDGNGKLRTFTREGIVYLNGKNTPILKHIEDINQNSEYPKWMMVTNQIDSTYIKRFVIGTILKKYVALNDSIKENSINYKKYVENPNDNSINLTVWNYAKEIEPENTKLQELEIKCKELGQEIEKLKNQ